MLTLAKSMIALVLYTAALPALALVRRDLAITYLMSRPRSPRQGTGGMPHRSSEAPGIAMKTVLLVSNRIMHYRVPVYNYFAQRFLGGRMAARDHERRATAGEQQRPEELNQ